MENLSVKELASTIVAMSKPATVKNAIPDGGYCLVYLTDGTGMKVQMPNDRTAKLVSAELRATA